LSEGPRLLHEHVERFNAGVRSGDFGPMLAAFAEDAELVFEGVPVGPFRGREAIAKAYRTQPPDDEVLLLDEREEAAEVVAGYAWSSEPGVRARRAGRRDAPLPRRRDDSAAGGDLRPGLEEPDQQQNDEDQDDDAATDVHSSVLSEIGALPGAAYPSAPRRETRFDEGSDVGPDTCGIARPPVRLRAVESRSCARR
jgi:hypothetical protein